MAPVARRVADRQKNRLVLAARFFKCLRAPRKPIDRVVRVLEQIRRFFFREAICKFWGGWCGHVLGLGSAGKNKRAENNDECGMTNGERMAKHETGRKFFVCAFFSAKKFVTRISD